MQDDIPTPDQPLPQSVLDEITPELAKFQESQLARAMAIASGEIERAKTPRTLDQRSVAERVNDAALSLSRHKYVGHVVAIVNEAIGLVTLVAKRRKGAPFYVAEEVHVDLIAADSTLLPRIVKHLVRKIRDGKLSSIASANDAAVAAKETAARSG